jgi:DNA repair protein RadC
MLQRALEVHDLDIDSQPVTTATITRLEYHATVHDIPVDERPRERLQKHGAEALNTAELLAIILRTGTTRDNVIEMANKLVIKYGGLSGLMSAEFHELCTEYGLGLAKAAQLKAALELGKRLSLLEPEMKIQIKSADEAARLVRLDMMHLDHEEMHVLVLGTKNHLVERVKLYKGTVYSSVTRSSEIFRTAIIRNCPHIIVCHNHPSGDPTPSPEDIDFTRQLIKGAELLDIELLDHLIIGNPRYVSLKERLHW